MHANKDHGYGEDCGVCLVTALRSEALFIGAQRKGYETAEFG